MIRGDFLPSEVTRFVISLLGIVRLVVGFSSWILSSISSVLNVVLSLN